MTKELHGKLLRLTAPTDLHQSLDVLKIQFCILACVTNEISQVREGIYNISTKNKTPVRPSSIQIPTRKSNKATKTKHEQPENNLVN